MSRPTQADIIARGTLDMSDDIKTVAHQQMAQRGTAGLSLRGIARSLGITAPAIYHYYPSLDDLITALIVDAFSDLAEAMEAAEMTVMTGRAGSKILAMTMAYRQWAIEHPVDFQLIYGNPIPGYEAPTEVTIPLARRPFMGIFRCYLQAYNSGELVIPFEYRIVPPLMAAAADEWQRRVSIDLPAALVGLLMSGWSHIHGMVMLELFHHSQAMVGDGAEFYRFEVEALLRRLGLQLS